MTALNKQAMRVPERKSHDWSQAVMRDCDFCDQWSLTVKHENSGCICASCCDAEYTSELKCALESAIDRAEAAEKRIAELREWNVGLAQESFERQQRIAELEERTLTLPDVEKWRSVDAVRAQNAYKVLVSKVLSAAGIGVKGE